MGSYRRSAIAIEWLRLERTLKRPAPFFESPKTLMSNGFLKPLHSISLLLRGRRAHENALESGIHRHTIREAILAHVERIVRFQGENGRREVTNALLDRLKVLA